MHHLSQTITAIIAQLPAAPAFNKLLFSQTYQACSFGSPTLLRPASFGSSTLLRLLLLVLLAPPPPLPPPFLPSPELPHCDDIAACPSHSDKARNRTRLPRGWCSCRPTCLRIRTWLVCRGRTNHASAPTFATTGCERGSFAFQLG